jgi:hypothetical protein
MKRFMISLAAVGLVLAMGSAAQAGGKSGSGNSKGSFVKGPSNSKNFSGNYKPTSLKNDHHDHDFKSDKGHFLKGDYHCYKGKCCNFWNYHCWDRRYGCYLYWDPCYCSYYYWCEPDECYYPISYCPYRKFTFVTVVTPVIYTVPVAVVAQPVVAATTSVVPSAAPAGPPPVPAP